MGENNITIGTRLWLFDINNRHYEEGPDGRAHGGPIYERHFREMFVIAENRTSYIIARTKDEKAHGSFAYSQYSVNKKTMRTQYNGSFSSSQVFTDETKALDLWLHQHHGKITRAVEFCRDADILMRVAHLVGYNPNRENSGAQAQD